MPGPTPRFYLGPGSTWTTLDASITWTEVTDYVLSEQGAGGKRGRSSELDDMRAGTFNFTLNNSTRRFDPTYTAGTYYGQLLPGVPVKVTGTANGTEYPVFRGFVNGWPQDYDVSNKLAYVNVSCTDGMAKLATAGTPSSVYAIEVAADSPTAWWRLSETAGTEMRDSSGNGYSGTYTDGTAALSGRHPNQWETVNGLDLDGEGHFGSGGDVPAAFTRPCTAEAIITPESSSSGSRFAFLGSGGLGIELYASVVGGGWTAWTAIGDGSTGNYAQATEHVIDGAGHHIAFQFPANPATPVNVFIDGVDVTGTNLTNAGGYPWTGFVVGARKNNDGTTFAWSLADVAWYDSDLGTTRIAAHAAAVTAPWDGDTTGERTARVLDFGPWPSDLVDIADGYTTLGPATLNANCLQLIKGYEKAEQGRFFISRDGTATFHDRYYSQLITEGSTSQVTFSDDGAGIGYSSLGYDDGAAMIMNRVRASRVGGAVVEVLDQASIDTYGEQVDTSLTGLQFGSDYFAQGVAEGRIGRYKDPQIRVRPVEVKLHGLTAAQQADILGLELGYRVTVERTPQGVGSQIAQEATVESITHRISGGQWTTTLALSPVNPVTYGVWGDNWGEALWGY